MPSNYTLKILQDYIELGQPIFFYEASKFFNNDASRINTLGVPAISL
jgi:hypothetical protein